jgi:hypothetical protein
MLGRVFITRYDRHLAPAVPPHWEVLWEDAEGARLDGLERIDSFGDALAWARARTDQIIVALPFDGGQYWAGEGESQPPGLPPWDWSRFRDE